MIPALLRPLICLWTAFVVLLLLLLFVGRQFLCLCFVYNAPPSDYGLTTLQLWDARSGLALKLAQAPFIGDVIAPHNSAYIADVQAGNGVQLVLQSPAAIQQVLEFSTGGIAAPHLSPDGRFLAFSLAPRTGDGLYLRDMLSASQVRIAPFPLSVTWLPDSQNLLYSLRNRHLQRFELYQYSLASDESTLILTNAKGFFEMDLAPDGTSLLYIKEQQLWRYDFATAETYPLDTLEISRMPRWVSNQVYAYQVRRPDGVYLRIVEATGNRLTLPNPQLNPSHAFIGWQPQ